MNGAVTSICVEASPGEVRAAAFHDDEAWDLRHERPFAGPTAGDIYMARAGALAQGGGRFFDLGKGLTGLARRPRKTITEGGYHLVQVLRGDAGDKGPRVTDRVWLRDGGLEAALGASGGFDARIEIARRVPKATRNSLRTKLAEALPEDAAIRISYDPVGDAPAAAIALVERLRGLAARTGAPRRVHASAGEVGWLVEAWPDAVWRPADVATAAWLAGLNAPPDQVDPPDPAAAKAIDDAVAAALAVEIEIADGAHLWIEPTRALTAIDIDVGASSQSGAEINLAGAREIARQLRLRRLGGLIAIDFLKDGLSEGIHALAKYNEDDPWPWTAPTRPDASGLVSFQRARLGSSLLELAREPRSVVYAAMRAVVRLAAADPARPPISLVAPPDFVHLLQFDLAEAVKQLETRLGMRLNLERSRGDGKIRVLDRDGATLAEL